MVPSMRWIWEMGSYHIPLLGTLLGTTHHRYQRPIDDLVETLLPILLGTRQARLRPLLVGRPHPKRRLRRWGAQTTISAALARRRPLRRHWNWPMDRSGNAP